MDIVSRLKQFLNANSIPVTQFADNCNITRPTFSQIINGRNKKISDEIISKIHEAYPDLSVYWLMFGEGEMLNPVSGQGSSSPLQSLSHGDSAQGARIPEQHLIFNSGAVTNGVDASYPPKNEGLKTTVEKGAKRGEVRQAIQPTNAATRYITKIVVFYNDNSFESFGPNLSNLI